MYINKELEFLYMLHVGAFVVLCCPDALYIYIAYVSIYV